MIRHSIDPMSVRLFGDAQAAQLRSQVLDMSLQPEINGSKRRGEVHCLLVWAYPEGPERKAEPNIRIEKSESKIFTCPAP